MTEIAFSTKEKELREAMVDTDPPVLLMSYAQLTGDREFIERFRPFIRKMRDFADNIPPELIDELHDRMVGLLCAGEPISPKALSREMVTAMMTICVGEPVPEEYMPMLLGELGIEPSDAAQEFKSVAAGPGFPEGFRVAIIGAGLSGICAAVQLKRASIEFEVFEKNDSVGGTWWENRYPGCGVDTTNHWYSYSFFINPDWTRHFVKRDELLGYLQDCVQQFGVEDRIRLSTRVTSAGFNRESADWTIATEGASGKSTKTFNAVICAVGQLNNPAIPDIAGLDSFAGRALHSSRWLNDMDLAGKRVAMIGTGATGTQLAPAIAGDVAHLDIFQRSAHWVTGRANYEKLVEPGKKWALRNIPYYARWYRFQLTWAYGDALYGALQIDPDWDVSRHSISQSSEDVRKMWDSYLEQSLADRPDLLAKSRPNFPPYGKRPLFDNRWFETLKRPNVSLVQEPIDHIEPEGIVTDDGAMHPTDIIVFATGFHASRMVYSVDIEGLDGKRLSQVWDEDNPRAYVGSTVPGFPNFFLLYGPNTNLAHGGSIAFVAERQVGYALRCLTELKRRDFAFMDVLPEAYEHYNDQVDARHAQMVWSVEDIDTWYKNRKGRVTTNSPWSLLTFWQKTQKVVGKDYSFSPIPPYRDRHRKAEAR